MGEGCRTASSENKNPRIRSCDAHEANGLYVSTRKVTRCGRAACLFGHSGVETNARASRVKILNVRDHCRSVTSIKAVSRARSASLTTESGEQKVA